MHLMVLQVGFNDLRSLLISCENMILYLSTLDCSGYFFIQCQRLCLLPFEPVSRPFGQTGLHGFLKAR